MNPWIVGITGYARSGKDTAAAALVNEYGFKRVSFADALKRDLIVLDPILDEFGTRLSFAMDFFEMSLEDIKNSVVLAPEWRRLMQIYGTEVWRAIDPNIWVTRLTETINRDWEENGTFGYVVPDLRFHNERDLVNFDFVFRVDRPAIKAINSHESELHIPDIEVNFVLINDGSIEDLHKKTLRQTEAIMDARS